MRNQLNSPSLPVLQIADGVATITLNRPAQRNRLENGDLQTLLEQFEQVNEDSSVRVLVITANTEGQPKPVFCAGYDIGSFDAQGNGANEFEQVPEALAILRPITICALNGSVYGGATDIVLACDLRVGLEGIEWRMPATAIGLHYYPSGLQRYIQRMGIAASTRAFLTARPFTWDQLEKLGLFEAFVKAENFDQLLNELTQDIKSSIFLLCFLNWYSNIVSKYFFSVFRTSMITGISSLWLKFSNSLMCFIIIIYFLFIY